MFGTGDESLNERLRRLRQAHTSGPSSSTRGNQIDPLSSSRPAKDDDIDALIASTRAELAATPAGPDTDEATLGHDDDNGDSDADSLDEELALSQDANPPPLRSMAQEAKSLSVEADRALREATEAQELLRRELPRSSHLGAGANAGPSKTPVLERLERPRPELVNRTSSDRGRGGGGDAQAQEEEEVDLERELRAAMEDGGDEAEGELRRAEKLDSGRTQRRATTPSTEEVDDLAARLSKLRAVAGLPSSSTSSARPDVSRAAVDNAVVASSQESQDTDASDVDSSTLAALSALAVPTTAPVATPSAASSASPSAPTSMRDRHGIDASRDLSSFSKLVRLDARGLAPPSEKKEDTDPLKGMDEARKKIRDLLGRHPEDDESADEEEGQGREDEVDSWCAICTADASLVCVGCDFEKYCSGCWAEGHGMMGSEELREHGTREYHRAGRRGAGKKGDGGGGGGPKLVAA